MDFDVIRRAKKMAMSRMDNYPWTDMSEEEILRSSGLILADPETGKEGITLAAILLFGKDSTIMSALPQYKTDAIYRVKNMDRYDDREVIITNLVDSFRKLMDFGKKHLNDVFVIEGDQSISARDKILREVVSNILAHRDYANAYTAQFVIERDKMYTKNSNLPHGHGELELNKFEPFPKNPPISKVFREIGYADELGSGMRNTNKYTKLYSGGVPKFVEENIFEIIIPIENVPELQVGGNVNSEIGRVPKSAEEVPKSAEEAVLEELDGQQMRIYNYVVANETITTKEAKELLGLQDRRARKILADMCDEGVLMKVGATSNLKYVLQKETISQ